LAYAKLQQRIALAKRIAALANQFFSVQDRAQPRAASKKLAR
jgi:hypothetical protein